tara:strand:+ start:348 stop:1136 length:789 start_codon:yes stop_codon:yes gene_type:complete
MSINHEYLNIWNNNKLINPISKRKIKEGGPTYRLFLKEYNIYKESLEESTMVDNYLSFRQNKIDPLTYEELPIGNFTLNDTFCFNYKWNSYTGERLNIKDTNGALYFDPNTLIHYFWLNRLNNLWIKNNNNYHGYYGDAVGNGPEFNIVGRGDHPDWYLFRLPLPDAYVNKDHCRQSVTMGPILTDKEIKEIYTKAKRYKNNYKKLYKKKRPNLLKMNQYYKLSISPDPLNLKINDKYVNEEYFQKETYLENTKNIIALSKI